MRLTKKLLMSLLVIIGLIVLIAYGILNHIGKRSLPDYNQDYQLTGLRDEVHVLRDDRAIPHIYAKNNHDLYFTTGFVMAQDRLWQMDLLRRVTQGRLSEIFGPDMVDTDQLLRALRMSKKSELVLQNSEPELISTLEAFSAGVNLAMEMQAKRLPPEFSILRYQPEPWNPIHTLNLIGYMSWDLASGWQNEISLYKISKKIPAEMLVELFPTIELQPTFVHPTLHDDAFALLESSRKLDEFPLEVFSASNNWAVAGSRSKTGAPLLANDMHLGFGLPGIWYQIYQEVEGGLRVSGVALPGAPGVIVGHNDSIAWGMTNLSVDEMDFYREELNDKNQYLFNDQWLDLEIVEEKIRTSEGDTIIRENRFTHRGPIVSGFKKMEDEAISMRWTGNEYSNEMRTIYLLNRANNWLEFRDALSTFGAVSQNIVYADRAGNIGMQSTGLIALRKAGDAVTVYPGTTDAYDWEGFLDFEKLPYTYNPPEGVVSSANNKTTGTEYPYYLGTWFDFPARINRIRQLLDETDLHDIESFKRIQLDQTSYFAANYTGKIVQSVQLPTDAPAHYVTALEALKDWDFDYTGESAASIVFEQFYLSFMHHVLADELGETLYKEVSSSLMRHLFLYFFEHPESKWMDNQNTEVSETIEDIVNQSFIYSVDEIAQQLGTDVNQWNWGKIHQLTLKHPLSKVKILDRLFHLNRGPFAVGGSFHTVNPMAYHFHRPFEVIHGASQRHIYNLAQWSTSQVVIPTGASGIPASSYYASQHKDFLEGHYKTEVWLSRKELEEKAVFRALYSPASK